MFQNIECSKQIIESGIANEMIRQLKMWGGNLENISSKPEEYKFWIEISDEDDDGEDKMHYAIGIDLQGGGAQIGFRVDLQAGDFGVTGEKINSQQLDIIKSIINSNNQEN